MRISPEKLWRWSAWGAHGGESGTATSEAEAKRQASAALERLGKQA